MQVSIYMRIYIYMCMWYLSVYAVYAYIKSDPILMYFQFLIFYVM